MAIVTQWSGSEGVCDRQIYINNSALVNGSQINIGSKVKISSLTYNFVVLNTCFQLLEVKLYFRSW